MKTILQFLSGLLPGRRDKQLRQQEQIEKYMTAIQNLTAAVTALATAVDAAVIVLQTDTPTEATIQASADAVNAQKDRILAALAPVTPPTPGA